MKYLKLFEEAKIRWYNKGKWEEEEIPQPKYASNYETIWNDKFTEFLIDNKAYEGFVRAVCKHRGIKSIKEINDYFLGSDYFSNNVGELINYAFSWDDTKEGNIYWSDLSYLWKIKTKHV